MTGSSGLGQEALAQRDWAGAAEALRAAAEQNPSPEVLDDLGRALWWLRRPLEAIEARSRAYREYRRVSELHRAAQLAVWLAREHQSLLGNAPAAAGWLARAETLANQLAGTSIPGWISLAAAESTSDPLQALGGCSLALEVARDSNDPDLEILALSRLGLVEVAAGLVEQGVRHLDEALTAALAGEGEEDQTLAEAYCTLVEATELLGDPERLLAWTKAMPRMDGPPDLGPHSLLTSSPHAAAFSAYCGACCGGIYMVTGRLDEAEQELLTSIRELQAAGMRSRCVHPVTQLAELRVLQGRLEEARLLLAEYEDLPEAVRPLALLDLMLGDCESAAARLRRRIEEISDLPLATFPLWVLLVEAELAGGRLESAGLAAAEVEGLAELTGSPRHRGFSLLCRGKLAAARGDATAASLLRQAAKTLSACSLPLMACRSRLELARALAASDRSMAVTEARAALAAFERLGARPDADAAAAFLRGLGVKGRTGPRDAAVLSKREREVLHLVAQGLSNAEIAERLYISVKTAGHHVSSILTKLGMRTRTEAAAYAAIHLLHQSVSE